jgi:CHAT domain-containing protein/tetratricopeptide (TPR) repeat protein
MKTPHLILFFAFLFSFSNVGKAQDAPSIRIENYSSYGLEQMDILLWRLYEDEKTSIMSPYIDTALLKAEAIAGKNSPEYAQILLYRGIYLDYELGKVDSAMLIYKQCQTLFSAKNLKNKHAVLAVFAQADILMYNFSDFAKSEEMYKYVLDLAGQAKIENQPLYSLIINNLGLCYNQQQKFEAAEECFHKALAAAGKKGRSINTIRNNLALVYQDIGKFEEAEALYLEIRLAYKDNPTDAVYTTVSNNLALLYRQMGNYADAENIMLEVKSIRAKTVGEKSAPYAKTLNNLSTIYTYSQRYNEAETMLLQSLKIRASLDKKTNTSYIESVANLGALYHKQKKYAQAEQTYKEAIQLKKEVKYPKLVTSLNNLAQLYIDTKEYDKALAQAFESLDSLKTSAKQTALAATLNIVANAYLNKGDFAAAENYTQQALAKTLNIENISLNVSQPWADSIVQASPQTYGEVEDLLSSLKLLYKNVEATQPANKNEKIAIICGVAEKILKIQRDRNSSEQDKTRLMASNYKWMELALAYIDLEKEQNYTFSLAESNKSAILMQAANNTQAQQFGELPKDLLDKQAELAKKQTTLEAQLAENRPQKERDSLRNLVNNLSLEINAFKKNVEEKYPRYAALKYKNKNIKITDIQALIDEKTALIEYVVLENHSYIIYIEKSKATVVRCDLQQDTIQKQVANFHKSLSDYSLIVDEPETAYQNYIAPAHWLYQNLLAPVLKNDKISHLIIIPDGALAQIPFEPMLTAAAPTKYNNSYQTLPFLLQKYKVSYNYSATLLKEIYEQPKNKNNGQILAMAANYDLKLDSTKQHLRLPANQRLRAILAPLPAARKEIEALNQQMNGLFLFDAEANEANFKKNAPNYSIIHLALHGLLNSNSPILSSLAFSENSDSAENNFLQAYEISKMKLNAQLVVLSACETGFGKIEKGNGLASIARAFVYAGTPALVVSLWSVNDNSTAIIMQHFYSNLALGQAKDEALQQAKIQYLQKANGLAAHPAFWSPFVQMGNSRAINTGNRNLYYWLAAAAAALALVAFFGYRYKNRPA